MFRFEHPEFLYTLFLPLILLGLFFLYRYQRNRLMHTLADEHLHQRLLSEFSKSKEWVKWGIYLIGLLLITIAYSNPQWGFKKEKVQTKSADIYIAIDISNSMLAQDVAPNRLERAKRFANDLVQELKGDRIGLILFAGGAYLQMPLSTDYAAAELFIKSANPSNAGTQGTAIGEALQVAMKTYEDGSAHHKALIILTDGEDHDEASQEMMEKAKDAGLVPYIIGVGTEEGGFIPINIRGREDYKRDQNGAPVRTTVNEQLMRDLAIAGEGRYFNISNQDNVISDLKNRLEQLEKQDVEERSFSEFESYFQYFLFLGLLLILIHEMLSLRRGKIRKLINQVKSRRA